VPLSVRNLPFRVTVPNIGLNGILITETQDSREFEIVADENAAPVEQTLFVTARVETNGGTNSEASSAPLRSHYRQERGKVGNIRPALQPRQIPYADTPSEIRRRRVSTLALASLPNTACAADPVRLDSWQLLTDPAASFTATTLPADGWRKALPAARGTRSSTTCATTSALACTSDVRDAEGRTPHVLIRSARWTTPPRFM
jgi:hypothetical protein